MKYAVLSDIHSNYEALDVVLRKVDEIGVDGYAFCGDLIGYGPDPEECCQRLMKLKNLIAVMGNHDMSLFREDFFNWFSDYAKQSMLYTAKQLSQKSQEFIKTFAKEYHGKDFSMVHGSFLDPFRDYLLTAEQFVLNLDKWKGNLCFVGHSHVPFIMSYKSNHMPQIDLFLGSDVTLKLLPGIRYMINPGSIGQPRDTNEKASFGIFDSKEQTFRLIRLPYDIKAVQDKIESRGLPTILSTRLKQGK
ncbi:metallophosphoesterase family protein [Candidatus Proelusimicrobium excrementi]|uniref:metallophosphoesterase family protein n=1 Tax=Candidatus Proelusimicrobium excrementi TaxID=3416222 RepID=UPI003C921B2C|nr:metallophosphoesterase family protein [Elusimicrobiaceae bacterium]